MTRVSQPDAVPPSPAPVPPSSPSAHDVPETASSPRPDDGPERRPDVPADAPLSTRERLLRDLLGRRRLTLGTTPRDRLWSWAGTVVVMLVAAAARLWELGRPGTLVFDETYYVKQAWTLLRVGYEARWPDDPNPAFEAGQVDTYLPSADYVVHPPVGKWMLAFGLDLGGGATNPWAWRISSAVVGIVAVVLVVRIARRLFASTAMGLVAGLLLAVDGEAIVHSRTGLLDQFLMFWVLVAFGCLLLDREQARRRLADRVAAVVDAGGVVGMYGPRLGWRWWRFAAAVSLGLACGVKWSGLYFLALFAVLSVLWDATARRTVGVRRWWEDALLVDAVPAALVMIPTAVLTYVATWATWFATPGAYMRQWAVENPGLGAQWLPPALRSWWEYHLKMWDFHNNLTAEHAYAAHPLGWIVQWRPTSFYWEKYALGQEGCTATEGCARAITSLGNPLLWWLAAAAIVLALVLLVRTRDWRALAVLSGTAAGWLPWFAYAHRTIFTFYSIAFTPFVVLTLVYAFTVWLERTEGRPSRRWAVAGITATVAAIVAVSALYYPIWTAALVPYDYWHALLPLQSWI